MATQLSIFSELPEPKTRIYIRTSNGRFATKEQSENDRVRKERNYYKLMYETQLRKNPWTANMIRQRDNEILRLKQIINANKNE